MLKTRFAKFGALAVGMTFAFGGLVAPVGAQTIAELQAQINALMAQLASLQGGSSQTGGGASVTFTRDLTLGSTGADVQALQSFLMARGHSIPNGPTTYFGPQTRAAVAAYQAANNISPAAGYFGPITRAHVNSAGGGPVGPGPSQPGPGITTPGVEGDLIATKNPTPTNNTRVYGGDTRVGVLGIRLEARTSDVRVERVTVQLPSTSFYNRVASRVYILDGSNVVGSADLNSNTVVRHSATDYRVTVSGMNYVVPRNNTRVLTVAFDIYSNVAGQTTADTTTDQRTVRVPVEGVRGVDGAGLNITTSSSVIFNVLDVRNELATEATLRVSLNSSSPAQSSVVASEGPENDELDNLELLRFDVRAERDAVEIIDLVANISSTGVGDATSTAVYLYDGSNLIGSDVVGPGGNVVFSNIDYVISRDQTRTFSIRVDIRDADEDPVTIVASVDADDIIAENTMGDLLDAGSLNGSATGQGITVLSAGPEITLQSTNITKSSIGGDNGTSTAQATFNVRIGAVGDEVALESTGAFEVWRVNIGDNASSSVGASYTLPTSGTVTTTGGRLIQEGNSITIPVTALYSVPVSATPGSYVFEIRAVKWGPGDGTFTNVADYMNGNLDWRTNSVVLP